MGLFLRSRLQLQILYFLEQLCPILVIVNLLFRRISFLHLNGSYHLHNLLLNGIQIKTNISASGLHSLMTPNL